MNDNEIAIRIEQLTKIYHLYDHPTDRLKEALHPFKKKYHHDFYALNDMNFEIRKGETVGIIGKNGAGKSTLLKIITGVLTQTSGTVQINGKIASLLELGAGFNPEMTGMENIYLNGMVMGFTHDEMEKKVQAIVQFADIGEFIKQPVKMYSSGMFARLAFSVAINVEPDILIIDEALSVGDTKFQTKSIKKMELIRNNGTTILFVSHATELIKRFCTQAIWIENAALKMIGEQTIIVDRYVDALHLEKQETDIQLNNFHHQEHHTTIARIKSYTLENKKFKTFDKLVVDISYEVFEQKVDDLLIGVAIYDNERNYVFGPNTYLDQYPIKNTKGIHQIQYIIPKINLLSGTYFFDLGIFVDKGLVNLDYYQNAIEFNIENEYFTEGRVYINHEWN